jgi:hypothetical protein
VGRKIINKLSAAAGDEAREKEGKHRASSAALTRRLPSLLEQGLAFAHHSFLADAQNISCAGGTLFHCSADPDSLEQYVHHLIPITVAVIITQVPDNDRQTLL